LEALAWVNKCEGVVLSSLQVDEELAMELGFNKAYQNDKLFYVKRVF